MEKRKKNQNPVIAFLSKWVDFSSTYFITIMIILFIFFIISIPLARITEIPTIFLGILIPIHLLLGIIGLLKKSIKLLLAKKTNFFKLFVAYTIAIVAFIALFSTIYILLGTLKVGYLSYGNCNGIFNQNFSTINDGSIVKNSWNTIYFSAITFFTIGYGDICPMGWNRLVAVFNAYTGHAFTTIILVIGLATYLKNKRKT